MTNKTATLIDNIFTNSFDYESNSGILCTDISDHFPIFNLNSGISGSSRRTANKPSYRTFSEMNIDRFKSMIEHTTWDNIYIQHDAELAYQLFFQTFNSIFHECFPLVKYKGKSNKTKPWFSSGLLKSSIKKNKLYRKFLKNPTPYNCDTYKQYKNKFTHLLRIAKKNYYSYQLKESASNIKSTWNIINELFNKKKGSVKIPTNFTKDGISFANPFDIANGFNDFFANVGRHLAEKIVYTDGCPTDPIIGCFPAIGNFDPPTSREVFGIIKNLNDTAAGHDEIKAKLFKKVALTISEPLTRVLMLSLKSGVVPKDLKIGKVIPLFKAGDPSLFNNYRPISILPCFSKVLEKLVYVRMLKYLNDNEILYKHQYGFRQQHSTYMALLQLIDKISIALDNNMFAVGIFLDLSKAFDTVDYEILISKLYRYGFRDVVLKWLKDYLINREQYVFINGSTSKRIKLCCGVPQGSILGPLLFLIYINDLAWMFESALPILFADDTSVVISHANFDSLMNEANDVLLYIAKWFQMNKLSLNIEKSNYIVFRNKNKRYLK